MSLTMTANADGSITVSCGDQTLIIPRGVTETQVVADSRWPDPISSGGGVCGIFVSSPGLDPALQIDTCRPYFLEAGVREVFGGAGLGELISGAANPNSMYDCVGVHVNLETGRSYDVASALANVEKSDLSKPVLIAFSCATKLK